MPVLAITKESEGGTLCLQSNVKSVYCCLFRPSDEKKIATIKVTAFMAQFEHLILLCSHLCELHSVGSQRIHFNGLPYL